MIKRFLRKMGQNSARHMRSGLKIIFAGIIGGQMSNIANDFTLMSILEISITSLLLMMVLIIAYEAVEWMYGRPENMAENKKQPRYAS
jgi:hypothetical protein